LPQPLSSDAPESTRSTLLTERLAIAGSGAIATGLAAAATHHIDVLLLARSPASAERARAVVEKLCSRIEGADADRVEIVTDHDALTGATFVVEAVVEDHDAKVELLRELDGRAGPDTILATTTSSLSVEELALASGRPEQFVGLHVFNPVTRMKLIELAFPPQATAEVRERTRALCEALDKTAVEVPNIPGFVVNRLLFPFLFGAVRLHEETGAAPQDIDTCMKLGAGHPMGPLALIDLVGLDVSKAIGETIGETIPARIEQLIAEGALGRKSGRGFYTY
jgi:3-hydroxybutyryl-CoA dehydrogenase